MSIYDGDDAKVLFSFDFISKKKLLPPAAVDDHENKSKLRNEMIW